MDLKRLVKASDSEPIWFPAWRQVLEKEPLTEQKRQNITREVITFLGYCKRSHAPATIMLCKKYLEEIERQVPNQEGQGASDDGLGRDDQKAQRPTSQARESLRWFVMAARKEVKNDECRATSGGRKESRVEGRM